MSVSWIAVGKTVGTLWEWIVDVCWLFKNARKVRSYVETKGAPICPNCGKAMTFQRRAPLPIGAGKEDFYRCVPCGTSAEIIRKTPVA